MSNHTIVTNPLIAHHDQPHQRSGIKDRAHGIKSNPDLAASITRLASKQTYYTIRFLVDRDRILNAFRAYAYFRWVDDWLDEQLSEQSERIDFVTRQQSLIDNGYRGEWPYDLTTEERLLVDLIQSDHEPNSGLQSYIRNLMAVMAFDANRRGRLISQAELATYSRYLAVSVTEALHYFIGHDCPSPRFPGRYLAVTGAHVTHMLRDTFEDIGAGYFNIPSEILVSQGINPWDVESDAYTLWVRSRVRLARVCFHAGKSYLRQVKSLRCRVAGYAYIARFEAVLDAIEQEGYRLRPGYEERKTLRMSWSTLWMMAGGLT
jgi:phytoene/squalene synthetase